MSARRSVLFFEKVFLKPRRGPARGVEIFNLNLLRDLCGLGWAVTVPVHRTWAADVAAATAEQGAFVPAYGLPGGTLVNGLAAAIGLAVGRRRFDALLLGNVANGLIPALHLLRRCGAAERTVLIAHREPFPRFVRALRPTRATVVAVNSKIASHFDRTSFGRVDVYYGITDAASFRPAARPSAAGTVRFCVLGQLDNPWKGADTAVAAFRSLPADVQAKCELHLASYSNPPSFDKARIRAYPWMKPQEIPAFLQGMDVLVVPSRDEVVMRETFSQAMVQGMLTGLPVIASDLPILTEKLDRGGGVVCADVAGLARAMERLAREPDTRARLGAEARQTALERYVWDTGQFAARYLCG